MTLENTNQSLIPEKILDSLATNFQQILISMYKGEPQIGLDGRQYAIDNITKINPYQGLWLYEFCLATKPQFTLEIGMAYGYSTLFLLAALTKNGMGYHTTIDPFQTLCWNNIGVANATKAIANLDNKVSFRAIEEKSIIAAIDLLRSNSTFDLIFIDGNHRFDDVLTDFYLYAHLIKIGGYIIFDDVLLPSINKVISFVRQNRKDFIEIETSQRNICIFQKEGEDSRKWNHFNEF